MKKRKMWIDFCKVIGIFFVALGHIARGKVVNIIYSFHMPFFVVLSGYNAYFSNERKKNTPILKLLRNLAKEIIPVVIFLNFFKILSGLIVNGFSISNYKYYFKLMLLTNIKYILNNGEITLPYAGATWFLFHLIVVMLLHTVLTKYFDDKTRLIIALFTYIIAIPNDFSSMQYLPMNLNSSLVSLLYFEIGFLFHKYQKETLLYLKMKFKKRVHYIAFFILFCFVLFYISTLNIGISLRTLEYGNLIYSTITTILIPITLMLLAIEFEKHFYKLKLLNYIQITGKNALYVLGIDSSIKFVIVSFYPFFLVTRINRIILTFIVMLIIIIIANIIEYTVLRRIYKSI